MVVRNSRHFVNPLPQFADHYLEEKWLVGWSHCVCSLRFIDYSLLLFDRRVRSWWEGVSCAVQWRGWTNFCLERALSLFPSPPSTRKKVTHPHIRKKINICPLIESGKKRIVRTTPSAFLATPLVQVPLQPAHQKQTNKISQTLLLKENRTRIQIKWFVHIH